MSLYSRRPTLVVNTKLQHLRKMPGKAEKVKPREKFRKHLPYIASSFISALTTVMMWDGVASIQSSVETLIWGPNFTKNWISGVLAISIALLILSFYVSIYGRLDTDD